MMPKKTTLEQRFEKLLGCMGTGMLIIIVVVLVLLNL